MICNMAEIVREIGSADCKRRARRPLPKPGRLDVRWGRLPKDSEPDLIFAGGHGTCGPDRALLCHALASPRLCPDGEWQPSLAEELHRRGYDLRTLRFTIDKREVRPT